MAEIHEVIRCLRGKVSPESNLRAYWKIVNQDAGIYATVSFAYQYLALFEALFPEEKEKESIDFMPEFLEIIENLNGLSEMIFNRDDDLNLSTFLSARKKNTDLMERLTGEADLFRFCEYIMNRLEHGYEGESELPGDYSDLSMTGKIMSYLSNEPQEGQNLAIQLLIEQLPLRITKNRFYELLSERLSIYKNADEAAFNDVLLRLRSVTGLVSYHEADKTGASLSSIYEEFRDPETAVPSKSRYEDLKYELIADGAFINANMDLGELIQACLNLLLSLFSSDIPEFGEREAAFRIIRRISEGMQEEKAFEEAELDEDLKCLEGIMEDSLERLTAELSHLDWIMEKYEKELPSYGLTMQYGELKDLSLLNSGSAFVSLDGSENGLHEVTAETFREETLNLINAYASLLQGASRSFTRAVMAFVNATLPPRFSSQEELENYIYSALSGCTNTAEKLGVLDIISDIMNQ